MIRARLAIVAIGIFPLLFCGVSKGQYISVKQSFWGKFQYTKNGVDFNEFGGGWKNLLAETEEIEEANDNIRDSRNLHYAGTVFAIGGGAIIGYASGVEWRNEDVDDGYWIAGGVITLASIICELLAKYRLEKGLLAYNKHVNGYTDTGSDTFTLDFRDNRILLSYNF